MRQSKLFPRTQKDAPKDEISANAQFLIRAGYIDKLMAGVYTYLPLGFRVLKKIENIVRKEMEKAGGEEILMPSLQPKENWLATSRWDSYDTLFRFASHYTKTELALGPTHEEIVSPLAAKFNLSYKNLPLYLFQIQNKFRDEKRAKSGILRGREFIMKDFYSFHTDENDLNDFYEKMKTHYKNIFDECGIGEKTYLTFASGGSFSKYSHEFQTITDAGEDIIYLCEKCGVAVNQEIIKDQSVCPKCGNKDLIEKKAIEVGNIFPLKTKYSEPFGLRFTDEKGGKKDVIMGCYGIGLGRLMGTIVETRHDEKGIIWPQSVSPFIAHLIEIKNNNASVKKMAEDIYDYLQKNGIEVLYDDREDAGAGEKFADADLIGIPFRIVVSGKTIDVGKLEIKRRDQEDSRLVDKEEIIRIVTSNK